MDVSYGLVLNSACRKLHIQIKLLKHKLDVVSVRIRKEGDG